VLLPRTKSVIIVTAAGIKVCTNMESMDETKRCCVCPLCPLDAPQCFITRKTLLQHINRAKEDPASEHTTRDDWKLPPDEELEWVLSVKSVYQKKYRWVPVDSVRLVPEVQLFGSGDFRVRSKFERKTEMLAKHGAYLWFICTNYQRLFNLRHVTTHR
jgi:hypothetical protein